MKIEGCRTGRVVDLPANGTKWGSQSGGRAWCTGWHARRRAGARRRVWRVLIGGWVACAPLASIGRNHHHHHHHHRRPALGHGAPQWQGEDAPPQAAALAYPSRRPRGRSSPPPRRPCSPAAQCAAPIKRTACASGRACIQSRHPSKSRARAAPWSDASASAHTGYTARPSIWSSITMRPSGIRCP